MEQQILSEKLVVAANDKLPRIIADLINEKMEQTALMPGVPETCRNIFLDLPEIAPSDLNLINGIVSIGTHEDISDQERERVSELLFRLNPWRKGPFNVFGIHIDTEWRSDMKWGRIENLLSPLEGRRILDIGCSNGYYMFKMLPHNPEYVIGIDPYPNFYFQFLSLQKYIRSEKAHYIPAGFEALTGCEHLFDTVFCMGILYHRKSPFELLERINQILRKGGELVLETIIIPGDTDMVLCPESRYAKMRNVFFIPTLKTLLNWLLKSGFKDLRVLDVSKTNLDEQRKTDWIESESLESFLDPGDPEKTVEGYPAPIRAAISAISK
ncbi:tRNA 5-methoxyuridine(34)/uridine 5-oxyacetic acid(34) synthase CmoB [Desulforegula conservatrix]|uniref:tRNA 5-methoxyuridine(34)/uridine 5-oxyacetic acid(34) synthase CmoB n=1 Tax=Desulforegula conservatrix TaxID=153026 RepID=UPI0003FB1A05|nr:tRNA 5-methoxyuridine(34)/uridine 5-oxyacetic acid(34) synthase CmoB [Desulforegula conservatrix]